MNLKEIIQVVAKKFQIDKDEMMSRKRKQPFATARQIVYYYTRKCLGYNYPEMASLFQRNHAAIHTGVRKIEQWRDCDFETKAIIEGMEEEYPFLQKTVQVKRQ